MQQPCTKKKGMPKITIIAKITKITNQGGDTGKYNKLLKESREWGLTNTTKIHRK